MGNFYTNVSLKNVSAPSVAAVMEALHRESYVLQTGADCIVYDRDSESQDTEVLAALAEHLATELDTVAFAVLNHDDDILWFQLYDRSELVAEYANQGGPRTKVGPLVKTLGAPSQLLRIRFELARPYVFQVDRHEKLVGLLGLPIAAVGSGFGYIQRDEVPEGAEATDLLHVRGG